MTNYVWRVTSGNFGAASSWTPNAIPTSLDTTNIDETTFLFGSGFAYSLSIYNAVTVTISATLTTTIADYTFIGGASGAPTVDVDAAWSNTSSITLGGNGNHNGYLYVNAGGSITAAQLDIGANYTDSSSAGTGTAVVQGGGEVTTNGPNFDEIGAHSLGDGSLTVTGAGSSWTSGQGLNVGDNGTGTLTVENDATLNTPTLDVGVGYDQPTVASGTGTVIIESGAVVTTTGSYQEIGNAPTGTAGDATGGATGAVTVTGAGSQWNADFGQFGIGDAGSKTGSLTISDGGAVTDSYGLYIGDEYNGPDGSYGTMLIESGGTAVTGGFSEIGSMDSGQPTSTATVTGAGSSWSTDDLILNASGSLAVTSGGKVRITGPFLGLQGGTVQVGSNSALEVGDVGGAALGYLTVDPDPSTTSANVFAEGLIEADMIDNGNVYSNEFNGQGSLTIEGPNGVADTGTLTGTGYLIAGTQSPLDLAVASVASTLHVLFGGWDATLEIESSGFSAPVQNFNAGDAIDIQGLAYANTPASYTFTPHGSLGGGTLVITEGTSSVTLDIAASPKTIAGALTLSSYGGGTGTAVTFTDGAAQSPFQLWSTEGSFFNTSSGTVDGEDYGWSQASDGGTPVWMETEIPASSYVSGAPGNYAIVLATQDWLGDIQPEITVATDNNFVDPFVNDVLSTGNLGASTIFSNTASQGLGGIVYWTASSTPGDYAVDLQPFTVSYPSAPASSNLVTITGSPVTMISAIANPLSWTFGVESSSSLVFEYATQATSTTENLYEEAFDAGGASTSGPPTLVASGLPDGTPYFVGYTNASGYGFRYLEVNGQYGTGMVGGNLNLSTGAVTGTKLDISLPDYTQFNGINSYILSSGNFLRFIEGVENGQAVIQTIMNSNSTPLTTFDLSSANDPFQTTNLLDPNTGALDYTALAYTDAGQVHLELLNETGLQVGGDLVIPGISSFLRLHTLQGSNDSSSTRVELDYAITDPNGGQEIEGFIYDTATNADGYTLSGGGLRAGTPFDDVFTWGPGDYTIAGGGGPNTFVVPETANQVTLSLDAAGDVVVQTYDSTALSTLTGTTTLREFTYVQMNDSTITISQTTNGESLTISAVGLLQLAGATPSNDSVVFNPAGGTLAVEGGLTLGGTIDGFAFPDKIDLKGLKYDDSLSNYSVSEVGTSDVYDVTVNEGSNSFTLTFEQSKPVTLSEFALNRDSGTGTELTAACYRVGTRILTARGEVAIENLAIGDIIVTASGAKRPVLWLGYREVNCARHPYPQEVWPVRVSAGAFGNNIPARDLWLSPGHSIASDGVLMPISALQNGKSVVQVEAASVEYWHVEIDAHDIVLAEGLAAESYLDTGNRTAFANGGAFVDAHPDFRRRHWADTCLPLALEGPAVVAAKRALLARLAERGVCVDHEAEVHVCVDGARVEPIRLGAARLAFMLPSGAHEIALCARTFVPAHALAHTSDPRALGLCIGALQIDGKMVALECLEGIGWHEAEFKDERFQHRWTTGETPLPAGARVVIVDLAGVGYFWSETEARVPVQAQPHDRATPSQMNHSQEGDSTPRLRA